MTKRKSCHSRKQQVLKANIDMRYVRYDAIRCVVRPDCLPASCWYLLCLWWMLLNVDVVAAFVAFDRFLENCIVAYKWVLMHQPTSAFARTHIELFTVLCTICSENCSICKHSVWKSISTNVTCKNRAYLKTYLSSK